jgi:hypothetical protein
MKTQWQIYQELELIPDAVPQPKMGWFAQLVVPVRRSFSNSFVRELADRHRIFLFNRCLELRAAHLADTTAPKFEKKSSSRRLKVKLSARPSASSPALPQGRSVFWWIWDEA